MDKTRFGRKLNTARKDCGLTGEHLAEICGLSPVYLRQIEAGGRMPSLPVFISLCRNLKVSPSYLLSEELKDHSIQEMDLLFSLWQRATPKQIKLITSMVKCALETLDGWEE